MEKVAIVTGAASGIGKEMARSFAHEGAHVAIADLNLAAAEKSAAEPGGVGSSVVGIEMDVANEEQVQRGVDEVAKRFGRIDVLVSDAGIQIVQPVHEFPFFDRKRLLAIHLDGAFLTTRTCLK